jgi:hypothetical protein
LLVHREFQELEAVEGGRFGQSRTIARLRLRQISERNPSRAVWRAGAVRKSSLKISSDSGPRYPLARTARRKPLTGNSP